MKGQQEGRSKELGSSYVCSHSTNGDVSVLAVCVVLCVFRVPIRVLSSVCCCALLCMDEWCVSGPCLRVWSIHMFKSAESMLLGSRDKERAVEDGSCFGHVCTSGGDTFHKEGRRKGQQEGRSKELGSSYVCSHSLRLIVFHVFSLSSGVFDWLRVCGLCMVWMDSACGPADLAHTCRICVWTSCGLNLCVCVGCVYMAGILRK